MKSLIRIILGAIGIMAFAMLIGIVHNAARSRSMPLVPQSADGPGEIADSATDAEDTNPALVSIERVKEMLDDPYAFIIDARSKDEYGEGHIRGALNVPYDRFAEFYSFVTEMIPLDAPIVCYCRSVTCDFSDHLAEELRIAGYKNVYIFREGWDAWIAEGNEIER